MRDQENELIDLGAASVETRGQGFNGPDIEGELRQPGLADD